MKPSYEELEQRCAYLEAKVVKLEDLLKTALERIAELEQQLKRNSKNSSKPPSTDQKTNTQETITHKKKAHPGQARIPYPPERVNKHINCELQCCPHCQSQKIHLLQKALPFSWQQAELPSAQAIVTQFNCFKYRCEECGLRSIGSLPEGVPFSAFGPKLMALIASLTGRFHLAKREAALLVNELYGIEISEGSVINMEEHVSHALDETYERIRRCVIEGPLTRHFDETTWRDSGKRRYVWIATNEQAAYYRIDPHRSREAFFHLIGGAKEAPAVTDRYNAYNALEGAHQYCFAHLIRDFHAFAERKGEDSRIGDLIEQLLRKACGIHAEWREGKLSERERKTKLHGCKRRLDNLFTEAMTLGSDELARLCERLSDASTHLWAFIKTEGMEPTNNIAERDLRKLVIWRKKSYGTRSPRGQRFVERITSVVESLKKHGKGVLQYLEEAIGESYRGRAPPYLCVEKGF